MKKFFTIVCLLCVLPLYMHAQTAEELLQRVSTLISAQKWNDATNTYRTAIGLDIRRSDIYYRTEVNKDSPISMIFAEELATYYKNTRNYERAYTYYQQLLKNKPNSINYLAGCAESAFGKGETDEALQLYDKIVSLDSKNLRANIFLGSYYFMLAEQNKRKLEKDFSAIASPSSMQRAQYHDKQKELFAADYTKAKGYLENVQKLFRSTEAAKMLTTIGEREKEMN